MPPPRLLLLLPPRLPPVGVLLPRLLLDDERDELTLLLRLLLDECDELTLLLRLLLDERDELTLLLRLLLDDEREELTLLLPPRLLLDDLDVFTLLLRPLLLRLLFIVVRLFVVVTRLVFMSVLRLFEVRDVTLLGVLVLLPFITTLSPLLDATPRRSSFLLVALKFPPYRLLSLPERCESS